jgi:hypothetical protein
MYAANTHVTRGAASAPDLALFRAAPRRARRPRRVAARDVCVRRSSLGAGRGRAR